MPGDTENSTDSMRQTHTHSNATIVSKGWWLHHNLQPQKSQCHEMAGNLKPAPEAWKKEQRDLIQGDAAAASVVLPTDEELQAQWKDLGVSARKRINARLRYRTRAALVTAMAQAATRNDENMLPAPEEWNARKRKEAGAQGKPEPTDAELASMWFGLTTEQRSSARYTVRRQLAAREQASVAIFTGTASIAERHLVERERKRHATKEAYIASKSVTMREWNDRAKEARHEGIQALAYATVIDGDVHFRTEQEAAAAAFINRFQANDASSSRILAQSKERKTGCVVPKCALATCSVLKLLNDDHIDRRTKVGGLDKLTGAALNAEILKVQTLCLWHHFEKTRDENNVRPVNARPGVQKAQVCTSSASAANTRCTPRCRTRIFSRLQRRTRDAARFSMYPT
jgi:hypothetical protein